MLSRTECDRDPPRRVNIMFYFAAMKHPDKVGVMVGASHNPRAIRAVNCRAGRNAHCGTNRPGRRAEPDPRSLPGRQKPAMRPQGRITAYDPTDEYLAFSLELAGVAPGRLRGLSLLHDYLHGAAGREMMLAFDIADADLAPLHHAAGAFPGRSNPVKQASIREGLEALGR